MKLIEDLQAATGNGTSMIRPSEEDAFETIINKSPSVSLAVTVLLGVLFLVTLAAIVTGVKAPGSYASESLMNVLRGNWSVVMKSMQFTTVSGGCNVGEERRRKKIRIDKLQREYGQKKRIKP